MGLRAYCGCEKILQDLKIHKKKEQRTLVLHKSSLFKAVSEPGGYSTSCAISRPHPDIIPQTPSGFTCVGHHIHEPWLRQFPSSCHTRHFQTAPRFPFYKVYKGSILIVASCQSPKSCIKPQSPFPTPSNAASVSDFTYHNWSLKDKKWQ